VKTLILSLPVDSKRLPSQTAGFSEKKVVEMLRSMYRMIQPTFCSSQTTARRSHWSGLVAFLERPAKKSFRLLTAPILPGTRGFSTSCTCCTSCVPFATRGTVLRHSERDYTNVFFLPPNRNPKSIRHIASHPGIYHFHSSPSPTTFSVVINDVRRHGGGHSAKFWDLGCRLEVTTLL
jgi:hypothetical protein